MKPLGITSLCIAFFLLAVISLGAGLIHIKHRFTPQTLEGWESVAAFIDRDPELRAAWEMLTVDRPRPDIVVAKARKAMLQAGAGFYVQCKYDPADIPLLTSAWKAVPSAAGTWRDYVTAAPCTGVRYDLLLSTADGPTCYAVVDSTNEGIVHYSGYAGDG